LSRRLRLLENRIDNIDQRLVWVSKQKEDRDAIVIELFKMLKESLDKRISTLMTVLKANNKN